MPTHAESRTRRERKPEPRRPANESYHDVIAEDLRRKSIFEQAKLQIQEKIAATRGETATFRIASAINPEEAAVFAQTQMNRFKAEPGQRLSASSANSAKADKISALASSIAAATANLPKTGVKVAARMPRASAASGLL